MPLKTKGLKPGSKGQQTFQVFIPGVGWRTISAFVRDDGSFYIIPPKRPALPVDAPVVNSTVPNPRILNKVKPLPRNLVMNAGRAGDPEPYCFGIQYARPIIIGADDDGERLVLDMLWSVGEIGGLSGGSSYQIWMPDIGTKSVPAGSLHEHFVGTAGQSASTIMTALKGSYDALPNKAHSVITMQTGWNLNILGVIWGVKCFDPRLSPQTYEHTENPALILADVFTRCGYTVDWDSVADAANWADGTLTSPNLQRSKIGGQIRDRQSLQYWVTALANYGGIYVDVRGGEVIFVADKPRSSTHTVTTSDIVAGTERLSLRGSRNAPSLVGVTYLLGSNNPATAYFGTSGGSGTESSLNMPFFDSQAVAGLKAKEVYNKGQNPIESLEFISWDDGLIRTLGDVGTITLPSLNLSNQLMALVENEPIQRGRWRRKYVEYDADNYPTDTTGIYGGNGNQALYNPYFPPEGPLPTLTYEAAPVSPEYTRIKIEFPNELWAYLKDFYVTVTTTTDLETILYEEYIDPLSSATSPQIHTTYTDFAAQTGMSPQVLYRVNVYVRSIVDALSETPGTADTVELDLTVGLQAWWAFEETSGPRYNSHEVESPVLYAMLPSTYDFSASPRMAVGSGSVGSTTGVLTGSSPLARAVQIDSASPADFLSTYFDSGSGIATASSFTIAGWVKFDSLSDIQFLWRKANIDASPATTANKDWELYFLNTGALGFFARKTGTDKTITPTVSLSTGTWYHVAAWFDEGVEVGLALNGSVLTTSSTAMTNSPTEPLAKTHHELHAGIHVTYAFGSQYPLNGALDEWGYWNRALTTEELAWLYNSGAGRAYADL